MLQANFFQLHCEAPYRPLLITLSFSEIRSWPWRSWSLLPAALDLQLLLSSIIPHRGFLQGLGRVSIKPQHYTRALHAVDIFRRAPFKLPALLFLENKPPIFLPHLHTSKSLLCQQTQSSGLCPSKQHG